MHYLSPILLYIVDNELIKFRYTGDVPISSSRAYDILASCFTIDNLLDSDISLNSKFHLQEDLGNKNECLVGYNNGWNYECITLDLKKIDHKHYPVSLNNICYKHNPIWKQVKLSTTEAFHIFSMLTANAFYTRFEFLKRKYFTSHLSREILQKEHIYYQNNLVVFGYNVPKKFTDSFHYAVDYLDYLIDQLLNKKITPFEIALLGGRNTLLYLRECPPVEAFIALAMKQLQDPKKLSFNRKIVYYLLLWSLPIPKFKSEFSAFEKEFSKELSEKSLY